MKMQKRIQNILIPIIFILIIVGVFYLVFKEKSNSPIEQSWLSNALFFADKGISGVIKSEIEKNGYLYLPIDLSLIFSGKENKYWGNLSETNIKIVLSDVKNTILETKEVKLTWDEMNQDFYIEDVILGQEHMVYETNSDEGYIKITNENHTLEIPFKFHKAPQINLDTLNWKTHVDDNFNYKINYPSEFTVLENSHSFGLYIDYRDEPLQKNALIFLKANKYTDLERLKNENVFFKTYKLNDEIYYFYSNFDPYNQNENIADIMIESFSVFN